MVNHVGEMVELLQQKKLRSWPFLHWTMTGSLENYKLEIFFLSREEKRFILIALLLLGFLLLFSTAVRFSSQRGWKIENTKLPAHNYIPGNVEFGKKFPPPTYRHVVWDSNIHPIYVVSWKFPRFFFEKRIKCTLSPANCFHFLFALQQERYDKIR